MPPKLFTALLILPLLAGCGASPVAAPRVATKLQARSVAAVTVDAVSIRAGHNFAGHGTVATIKATRGGTPVVIVISRLSLDGDAAFTDAAIDGRRVPPADALKLLQGAVPGPGVSAADLDRALALVD